eukprot:scaffold216011_cov46-Prasinocladus_malaysianus.AAC.1
MQRPTVTSITTTPTSGGTVTITGTNFGPVSPMVVSLRDCHLLLLQLSNRFGDIAAIIQVSVTKKIFSYEPPTITSISEGRTEGDYITITGTNFGPLGSANLASDITQSSVVGWFIVALRYRHTSTRDTALKSIFRPIDGSSGAK